ncbi:hypothetical protein [uncultured Vibrio sp.]|uniref:esterase/lipase family protein n=1 Tax=uncultured Vibrio sp. TaxID=114054 RepID=UPI0025EC9530|nr:hypothetical protein [uncultured Vibrio sp.]
MNNVSRAMLIVSIFALTSCTYLKYSAIQNEYSNIQTLEPSKLNLKHMISQGTYFVWGLPVTENQEDTTTPMAIAAYSSEFEKHELVDTMFFTGTQTHYALNLPEGRYTVLIYADTNNNQLFESFEVVAQQELQLNPTRYPDKLAKNIDIPIEQKSAIVWAKTLSQPENQQLQTSLYYPSGTIRRLDDPIFDKKIATMGMYDPASFLELAPTMFFALNEDVAHKIPVIFVHGIGDSSRSFKTIIDHMDLDRYQPWFFYYPSGADLDQFADFFYSIFLSGSVVPTMEMPMIVVAHSMGGLIVRSALNKRKNNDNENRIKLFVSIASPFGGHPAAALGEEHGLIVLPAWRDLNPDSDFIRDLYHTDLPDYTNHQLFYAYSNEGLLKVGENSDGVVPLSSQLQIDAQQQSDNQFGFNSNHVNVLENEEMIVQLLNKMETVENIFPDAHINMINQGGFDIALSEDYSPISKHIIGYAGQYLVRLIDGQIEPINDGHAQFVRIINGEEPPQNRIQEDFIRFMRENSEAIAPVLAR